MGVYRTIFFVGHTVYCHHLHCQDIDSGRLRCHRFTDCFCSHSQYIVRFRFFTSFDSKKDAGELEFSTVFFLNLMVGILLYAILYVCSPYIARFYNIPDLTDYARILFLIVPVSSFGLIQNVIIQKCLQFKKSAIVSISASLLSGLIGIWMAYAGYGIMALVIQQLSLSFIRTVLYTAFRRWKPTLKLSLAVIREMFAFSMNLMLHSLINTIMKNIYTCYWKIL